MMNSKYKKIIVILVCEIFLASQTAWGLSFPTPSTGNFSPTMPAYNNNSGGFSNGSPDKITYNPLANPIGDTASGINEPDQMDNDLDLLSETTTEWTKSLTPIIKFSEFEEGTALNEGNTDLAQSPFTQIITDDYGIRKGINVLQMEYASVVPDSSAVWHEVKLPSSKKLSKEGKIVFPIRGLKWNAVPDNIILRAIKKDGSYSEVVIGEGIKELGNYADVKMDIKSDNWQTVSVPVSKFIDSKKDRSYLSFGRNSKIQKFTNPEDIKDVQKIAIVIRGDTIPMMDEDGCKLRIANIWYSEKSDLPPELANFNDFLDVHHIKGDKKQDALKVATQVYNTSKNEGNDDSFNSQQRTRKERIKGLCKIIQKYDDKEHNWHDYFSNYLEITGGLKKAVKIFNPNKLKGKTINGRNMVSDRDKISLKKLKQGMKESVIELNNRLLSTLAYSDSKKISDYVDYAQQDLLKTQENLQYFLKATEEDVKKRVSRRKKIILKNGMTISYSNSRDKGEERINFLCGESIAESKVDSSTLSKWKRKYYKNYHSHFSEDRKGMISFRLDRDEKNGEITLDIDSPVIRHVLHEGGFVDENRSDLLGYHFPLGKNSFYDEFSQLVKLVINPYNRWKKR